MAEEIFEVEKIAGHNIVKKGKKYDISYLIKWLGYGDADNTWEKEGNVFAVDMIINYWNSLPKNNADRQLFEKIQSTKKKPIILEKSHSIMDTFKGEKAVKKRRVSSVAGSSSPAVTPEPKTQTTLDAAIVTSRVQADTEEHRNKGKGKEKEVDNAPTKPAESMDYELEKEKKSPSPKPQPKRLPEVIAHESEDELIDDDNDELVEEDSPAVEPKNTDSDYQAQSSSVSVEKVQESESSSEVEIIAKPRGRKKKAEKRKRSAYSDYFLEEHEKKKRHEKGYESTESEKPEGSLNVKESDADTGSVIFDEYFGTDPPIDWDSMAEKVTYIGQELPESPLYCIMKWKDGVKSVHPLTLVREKRPDLVIDCFVGMIAR